MSDDSPFDRYDEEVRQRLECLEILRQGADVWNVWRKENPNILPDLSQANLRRTNLKAANFSEINLRGANLEEANLDRAIFWGADLNRANLRWSYLVEADFGRADMREADLTGANLRWAFFIHPVDGARLNEALHLTQKQIETAEGNWRTLLPPGLIHPDHWDKEPEISPEPATDSTSASGTKLSLSDIPSPVPMEWNADGKIAVVAPKERLFARGLSPATRDLLARALTDAAADLAKHIRSGNSDQNIANRLDAYARECAKGGAQLNVLRLDAIIRTLSGLVRNDTDALSAIDSQEYSVFADDHDRLTRFYPDFEDYQRALASAPNIPAPPNLDLAKLLREPPGPDIIDVSIPDAIDDILPRGESLPDSRRTDTQETNERKFSLMKIVEGLKLALEMPGAAVGAIAAIPPLYAILKPLFDWLMLIF